MPTRIPMNCLNSFAAFILTHGRPDKVITYQTLRNCGYTGKIYIVIDDTDKARDEYLAKYGDAVIVFDKKAIAQTFDQGDNFNDMRAIIYARNASFQIAKDLGLKHFIQLDDDYKYFTFRFNKSFDYVNFTPSIRNLDSIFSAMVKFMESTGALSIAMSQGGDWIGGGESSFASSVTLKRKCMNSFICSTERPFQFVGRINEDVNTYTRVASTGGLFFTANQISLGQLQTQSNDGGMSDIYKLQGTYVKSFYSVMYMPSSVRIGILRDKNARIHHNISWKHTVPMILRESLRK